MSHAGAVPRLAAPLILAAAILVSFRLEKPVPPVALQAGEAPPPTPAELEAALAAAEAPGAPGYDRGVTRAPVTVLEFADFGCPYCARFALETYPALDAEFVQTGRVRWRYVPFVLGIFANGNDATRAAECAAEQGGAAFGRMHDGLFARQGMWRDAPDPPTMFHALAQAAGLDLRRFDACVAGGEPDRRIAAANALADRLGAHATPTFFVNGRRVEGALPVEQFRAVLLDALAAARTRGAPGAAAPN